MANLDCLVRVPGRRESRASDIHGGGLTSVKRWEQPKCPLMDEWMSGVHPRDGILFGLKKEGLSGTGYNVDGPCGQAQ